MLLTITKTKTALDLQGADFKIRITPDPVLFPEHIRGICDQNAAKLWEPIQRNFAWVWEHAPLDAFIPLSEFRKPLVNGGWPDLPPDDPLICPIEAVKTVCTKGLSKPTSIKGQCWYDESLTRYGLLLAEPAIVFLCEGTQCALQLPDRTYIVQGKEVYPCETISL